MTAADLAHVLGGHRSDDRFLCRCPVPSHGKGAGDRNPSRLLKDGETRLLIRCFAGCEAGDVLVELRQRDLMGQTEQHKPRSDGGRAP